MALVTVTPSAFARALTAKRVFIAGFTGEPSAVIDAIKNHPIRGQTARMTGVQIPGVNRHDLSALVPDGLVESYFVTPALRDAFVAGRVAFRPMHYTAIYAAFCQRGDIDLAIMRVSLPHNGRVSLGLAHDFGPAIVRAGIPLAGMLDPATPYVPDGVTIGLERFSALIDGPSPHVMLPPDPLRPELAEIAHWTATLVHDGDSVQTGLGSAPNAVLAALRGHKNLRLHGGMVTDSGLGLLECGAVAHVTTGAAICGPDWTQRLAAETRVSFRPVSETHGALALAALPNLVAINSALEVDLFGQVNGEMIGGRQISGHGGLADFVRGARLSTGGRSIIVLSATGERGRATRIVPSLPVGAPVAITRGDIDWVVTEHGTADLRDTDIDSRAARLIAIAAPNFRSSLSDAWDRLRRAM